MLRTCFFVEFVVIGGFPEIAKRRTSGLKRNSYRKYFCKKRLYRVATKERGGRKLQFQTSIIQGNLPLLGAAGGPMGSFAFVLRPRAISSTPNEQNASFRLQYWR